MEVPREVCIEEHHLKNREHGPEGDGPAEPEVRHDGHPLEGIQEEGNALVVCREVLVDEEERRQHLPCIVIYYGFLVICK